MSFGGFDIFPFVVGLLGSLHCLGMCGMLVLACSLPRPGLPTDGRRERGGTGQVRSALLLQVLFHSGRLTTYVVAGAIAAGSLSAFGLSRTFQDAYAPAAIACGALLLVFALAMAGLFPIPDLTDRIVARPLGAILSRAPTLIQSPRPMARFILGLLTGLLPCCLSWAMVATAASTQAPLKAAWTMLCFGLGTVPALAGAALFGFALPGKARLVGERLSALVVGGMGLVLLLRGFGILH